MKKFGRRWLGLCSEVKPLFLKLYDLLLDGGRRRDTPMARWAGSREDWIQKWRTSPRKKAEMIPKLVLAIHLSTLQVKKADGGIPLRKERDLDS